ncbi:MAG: hypothetical protein ACFCU8_12255 [Thermosynechococcaceae cyanobacterium]
MKVQIVAYEQQQQQGIQPSQPIDICVGNDEVFFGEPVLVTLELSSGFILMEINAANRQYETWQAAADAALLPTQFHCRQMVSDGAQALIKLALKGLWCQ